MTAYNVSFEASVTVEADSFDEAFGIAHDQLGALFVANTINEPFINEVLNEDTQEAESYS